MPSYRFCRPDDIPYLVRAVNECYTIHFPDEPAMTVERFRAEMKALDLWPSNCVVASSGAGPVAVLIGTKRAREVSILRIGVRSDEQRRGHGAHLLTSLSQKLAVLGPERLVAEVPLALDGVPEFFEAVDYRREALYVDWTRPPSPVEPVPEELLIPITVDELDEQGLLDPGAGVAWERSYETLKNRGDDLEGVAIASPERVEAFVLSRPAGDAREVLAARAREGERRELFLSLLLRHLAGTAMLPLRLPKLADDELSPEWLEGLGFEPGARYARYAATATPA